MLMCKSDEFSSSKGRAWKAHLYWMNTGRLCRRWEVQNDVIFHIYESDIYSTYSVVEVCVHYASLLHTYSIVRRTGCIAIQALRGDVDECIEEVD